MDEIVFDDEIPCGDEIRLDGGRVDFISSEATPKISSALADFILATARISFSPFPEAKDLTAASATISLYPIFLHFPLDKSEIRAIITKSFRHNRIRGSSRVAKGDRL